MADDYDNLKSDSEGMYSLSHKKDADELSKIIKDKYGDIKIMDGTSGIGGNSISFGKNFSNVISIEMNQIRFSMLLENLKNNSVENKTFCGNFLDFLDMDFDLIFLDPPWGGPGYKNQKSVKIFINDKSLTEITKELKEKGKIIIWKLPFNYYLEDFKENNYQIMELKNYLIIIID